MPHRLNLDPPSVRSAGGDSDYLHMTTSRSAMSASLTFISYSRKDQAFALEVYERMTAAGLPVWIDQRSIRPGMSYAEAIVRALDESTAVVLLFTAAANESREIHKEIQLASDRRLPILPVRMEDVIYDPALAYHLAAAQWIDALHDRSQAIGTLIDHFRGDPEATSEKPALVPAPEVRALRRGVRRWLLPAACLVLLLGAAAWLLVPRSPTPQGSGSTATGDRGVAATAAYIGRGATPESPQPTPPVVDGPRVAVMYFDFGGGDERLSGLRKGFADMMVTDLRASGRLNLIERERLEGVLKELRLQRGAAVDAGTAMRIGKLLGAEYLLFGSYFEIFGTLRVDAKLVRVETGQIMTSEGLEGPMTTFSSLQRNLTNRLLAALSVRPPTEQPAPAISTEAVLAYSKILEEVDAGRASQARVMLKSFREAHPDFLPAKRLASE